ncbi:MAG: glycosyltransferase family A protein [Pseudomonadota bacterium]
MTVQIFTSVVNRPRFLEYQARLFRKYLRNDYRFHVVDDSVQDAVTGEYERVCREHGLLYHRKPKRIRRQDPSAATSAAIQWAYDTLIRPRHASEIVLFLDSDMFLIDAFDVEAYIDGYAIAGLLQRRGHVVYLWNGLMLFNMPQIMRHGGDLDFSCGRIEGFAVDTGGGLYHFIHRDGVKLRETDPGMQPQYPRELDGIALRDAAATQGYDMELHCGGRFLHYRAASNWFGDWRSTREPLEAKLALLERVIATRL